MRVNRIYDRLTVQGEGPYTGARCTFVRLYGCNLHCAWCDSAETWDIRGRNGTVYRPADNSRGMGAGQVADQVTALDVDLVVVTGGEPLLQRHELIDLAQILRSRNIAVHVETNGTFSPGDALAAQVEHFVVSPKLPSAAAGGRALNLPILSGFARMGWRRASFKTVVMSLDDLAAAHALYEDVGVPRRARWAMPEGITPGKVGTGLADITEAALAYGMSVTGRQHVMLWGDERGR